MRKLFQTKSSKTKLNDSKLYMSKGHHTQSVRKGSVHKALFGDVQIL